MQFIFFASKETERLKRAKSLMPAGFKCIERNEYILIYKGVDIHTDGSEITVVKGFVHHLDASAGNTDIAAPIRHKRWPITDISGQFSLLQYKPNEYLNLCTDPIGLYPLYYKIGSDDIVAGTLISLFSLAGIAEPDHTGIVAKLLPVDFQTMGSRTVLKGVSRLMSGEFVHHHLMSGHTERYFDNSIHTGNEWKQPRQIAAEYTELLEQEAARSLHNEDSAYLAMSGGIDSRLIMASTINSGKKLNCVSYGRESNIDVKLARNLAEGMGQRFESFDAIPYLFPPKDLLFKYAVDTGSVLINPWLSILEGYKDLTHQPTMLVGDMCDFIRAKNIVRFKSRDFRIKSTLQQVVLGKELKLTPFKGNTDFVTRKLLKNKEQHLMSLEPYLSERGLDTKELLANLKNDVADQVDRIKRFDVAYEENFEELFFLQTHGRLRMATQVNILTPVFRPISLPANMALARYALNINPLCRLGDKVTHQIFKLEKYKKLGNYPTAQVPFIAYNSNYYLILALWALRNKTDQFLIRRMVKKSDPNARQRIFEAFEHEKGYTYPGAEENFSSYFEGHESLAEYPLRTFDRRKNVKVQPVSNADLIGYVQALAYLDYFQNAQKAASPAQMTYPGH